MVSDSILDDTRRQANESAIALERHLANLQVLPNVIEQYEASVAEANALVEGAELDLRQTRIVAPFPGRVIRTFVAPGDRVVPGSSVIQVADYDGLEVRASIPVNIGAALRRKFQLGIAVGATGEIDGKPISFSLTRLSGDVKTGQSGIDAFFRTSSNESLDIGRVVNLTVTLPSQQNLVALPVQSIYENDRIYRVEQDDRLKAVQVEQVGDYIDERGDYQILVRSDDIGAGDRLITTQLPRAISGLLVEAIDTGKIAHALASEVKISNERLHD